jgi:hypothetical protein
VRLQAAEFEEQSYALLLMKKPSALFPMFLHFKKNMSKTISQHKEKAWPINPNIPCIGSVSIKCKEPCHNDTTTSRYAIKYEEYNFVSRENSHGLITIIYSVVEI